MGKILVETRIHAPIERVFDLARSIDLHTRSTSETKERAVAGTTEGLIGLGETVSWEAEHFRLTLGHTSKITAMEPPSYFRDEMVKGNFKSFVHDHFFEEAEGFVLMTDDLDLESPYFFVGKIVDSYILDDYFRKFLMKRNEMIKETAESDLWREYLQ